MFIFLKNIYLIIEIIFSIILKQNLFNIIKKIYLKIYIYLITIYYLKKKLSKNNFKYYFFKLIFDFNLIFLLN